jgi:hypothetical protein
VEAGVAAELVAQAAGEQFLPLSQLAHAPALQLPVVPHVFCNVTLHFSCGSGELSATAVHLPADDAKSQAMHASVQSELQHTPWAQWPDWHSLPVLHWPPFGIKPHDPFTQRFPLTHCWTVEHATKQLEPLQMKGLQVRDGGVTHWPDWLQVAAGVYAPWTQVSVPQTVPARYI